MNGPESSRSFFFDWGLPWLQRTWPTLADRLAAGRLGSSDTIGADEEWSQDLDEGLRFDLLLTEDDFRRVGQRLRKEINAAALSEIAGPQSQLFAADRENVTVQSIDACCQHYTGHTTAPARAREWIHSERGESLVAREPWLYYLKHSAVFHDPLGKFSARRKGFAHYPRDVRLKVMQTQCTTLWNITSYRHRWGLARHTDPYPLHSAISQTAEAAMRLCFYLHDDYAPHWQWLHRQFLRLPEAKELGPILDRFLAGRAAEDCAAVVPEITEFITRRLAQEGLIQAGHADVRRAADELNAQISDRAIREMT